MADDRKAALLGLHESAAQMSRDITELIKTVHDYDLERLLKKVDAELMDIRHNLNLAVRLLDETAGSD